MIKINHKKGFTLLEALVAISVLMVAVAAPITIAQKGLNSANFSRNQMVASYLAQDAIEYIKNKRDQYAINNPKDGAPDWTNWGAFTLCAPPNGCQIDTTTYTGSISTYIDGVLYKNDGTGLYSHTTTAVNPANKITNFKRKIQITRPASNISNDINEALVTVTVNWGAVTNPNDQIVVKTLIYNY